MNEPTDAQVLAALNAYDPRHATTDLADYSPEHIQDMTNAVLAALSEPDVTTRSVVGGVRDMRECTVCGEKATVSNATQEWEERHAHSVAREHGSVDHGKEWEYALRVNATWPERYATMAEAVSEAKQYAPIVPEVLCRRAAGEWEPLDWSE